MLGVGGMGEVYRATDAKLKRQVALKVLPEALTADPHRLARFQREAEVLASLNHPHIAQIYGLEDSGAVRALIMELVEGATLADRLAKRPLSLNETVMMADQLIDALDAAHEKGIVHRDLKPGNIAITPDGLVKVLDFGLAKIEASTAQGALAGDATVTAAGTLHGVILGTAAYMSPEQARGRSVDKRTDIWAFGCVLYESLTGRAAFGHETVTDTLAAIVEREPDWTAIPPQAVSLRPLIERCLQKDVKQRLRDIADARPDLERASRTSSSDSAMPRAGFRTAWRAVALVAVAFLAIGAVAGALGMRSRIARPTGISIPVRSLAIPVDGMANVPAQAPVVSPDGTRMAFVASRGGTAASVWIQSLADETPRELPGTSGASFPFWSPDGHSLGFFADGALKRIELSGGSAQRLAPVEEPFGGAWGATGVIIFSKRYTLYQVSAGGGTASLVADLDETRQENSLRYPEFLPDGRRFLYVARSGRPENTSVYLASLDGGAPKRLFATRSAVRYAPGTLLYVRDDAIVAQPFDISRGDVTSQPRPIVGSISTDFIAPLDFFSVSNTGVLAYHRPASSNPSQLTWVDRAGRTTSSIEQPTNTPNFRISPDERRIVFDGQSRGSRRIWILDLDTGARSPLTIQGSDDWQPIWSEDGHRILFASYRNGPLDVYVKAASGGGGDEALIRSPVQKGPRDWRNGFVLYTQDTSEAKEDVLAHPVAGGKPTVIAATPYREFDPRFSADGRWVSYVSNETGADEIYIQPFPPTGNRWLVSRGGGRSARWREDGRELFYLAPMGEMKVVPIVPVAAGESPVGGLARTLFRVSDIRAGGPGASSYEVTRDGQRFLLNRIGGSAPPSSIPVILNWTALP